MRNFIFALLFLLTPIHLFAATGAIVTVDKQGWRIDANIGGANTSMLSTDVTSYTEITDAGLDLVLGAGSATAEIPCSSTNPSTGLTCAAGSESIGIAFSPPTQGTYDVCFAYTHLVDVNTGGTVYATHQLVETPNNAQTILQEGSDRTTSGHTGNGTRIENFYPKRTCGTFTFSDTSKKTIRLMYEQETGGSINSNQLLIDRGAAFGNRDLDITVRRRVEFADAVKFTNLVTSREQIGERNCRFSVNMASGSPVITSNPGSCISGVADNGVGEFTATFTSGWTSGTSFMCQVTEASSNFNRCVNVDSKTSSTTRFEGGVCDTGLNSDDYAVDVFCVGN
jgi:hypothetical protein